jgi:triacylglycerol lipase
VVSPQRLLLLRLLVAAAAVLSVVLVAVQLSSGSTKGGAVAAQATAGPVLLVPGYGGGTGGLTALRSRLVQAGRTASIVTLPGDGTGDLAAAAAALGKQVDKALGSGAPSVDLVGYSAGGVVVRLYVAQAGRTKVRRAITLGSPNHGTAVAGLAATFAGGACPAACQQLVPGSALLDGLTDTPDGPTWLSVWTSGDEVVTPPSSARLDGARNVVLQDLCPGLAVSHEQLPDAPVVIGIVVQELGASSLPAGSSCAALTALSS